MIITLNIYYQNVRGLRTKTNTIFRNLLQQDNDIVCFTETWLHGSIFDTEIFDSRYTVYRSDRCYDLRGDSMGGGVLIAVNSNLPVYSSSQIMLTNKAADVIKVSIRTTSAPVLRLLHVYCCYFPHCRSQYEVQCELYEIISQ